MIKMRFGCAAAVALLLSMFCSAPSATAGALVAGTSKIKINYSNFPGTNGEFGAFIKDTDVHNSNGGYVAADAGLIKSLEDFRTFCVEHSGGEYIYNNEEVTVSTISTVTSLGASLTNKAAWLFKEFSTTLKSNSSNPNFLYNGTFGANTGTVNYDGSANDANLMQDAIWYYVGGQVSLATVLSNKFYLAAENGDNSLLISAGGLKGIRVITLTSAILQNGTSSRQDMLWDTGIPESGSEVPEPGTFVIFAIGLVGAVWSRRRHSSSLIA